MATSMTNAFYSFHCGSLLNGKPRAEDIPVTNCHNAINQNLESVETNLYGQRA